jgi:uncharacterized protein YacL
MIENRVVIFSVVDVLVATATCVFTLLASGLVHVELEADTNNTVSLVNNLLWVCSHLVAVALFLSLHPPSRAAPSAIANPMRSA